MCIAHAAYGYEGRYEDTELRCVAAGGASMADEPAHIHYSTRLGKDLVLQRHAKNQFGWLGVYAKKEKLGIVYHAKLRLDPNRPPARRIFTHFSS